MQRLVAEPVPWAPRCVLAESPRWHDDRWWWVDAPRGRVHSHRPAGDDATLPAATWLSAGTRVSLVHPARAAGTMLVARGPVLQFYRDPAGGGAAAAGVVLAELSLPPGWLLNDGTAGPAGGLYIGAVHPDRTPGSGYLQHVRPDGSLGARVSGTGLSNGMAVDTSGTLLYHADSTGRVVLAHRLDGDGEITGSAVHLRFEPGDGMPDGLATDTAGGLWVAVYGAGEVRRYAPDGEPDLVVSVPTPQVTSVALGGPDGRDLLITTAREGYDDARSAAEPLAGLLFAARSPHPGRPTYPVRFDTPEGTRQ